MACNNILFSAHGLTKLTVRDIDAEDVIAVAQNGVAIFQYPNDKPYPSRLMLGWLEREAGIIALHVVLAEDPQTETCIIITAYWPDDQIWMGDYKTKR